MAFHQTDFYTASAPTRLNTSALGPANVGSGEVEFASIPYVVKGSESATNPTTVPGLAPANGDVINLLALPAGAIPRPDLSNVVVSQGNGTMTVDIGTVADEDGWAVAANVGAVGRKEITAGTLPAWAAARTPIVADASSTTGNAVVYARVKSASGLQTGTVITFNLAYQKAK